jgi:hypothetical protein
MSRKIVLHVGQLPCYKLSVTQLLSVLKDERSSVSIRQDLVYKRCAHTLVSLSHCMSPQLFLTKTKRRSRPSNPGLQESNRNSGDRWDTNHRTAESWEIK